VQPDTIIPDLSNPQGWNRYSYVSNSPTNYSDPSGHGQCRTQEDCEDLGVESPYDGGDNPDEELSTDDGGGGDGTSIGPSNQSFTNGPGAGLFGPPGGPGEPDDELPDDPGEIPPSEVRLANATGIAKDLFAFFTYEIYPNFNPEWNGYGIYGPVMSSTSPLPIPLIQPKTSVLWWKVAGVGVTNNSYESINVTGIYTSQGGDKFNRKNSSQIYPFGQPTYTSSDYGRVNPNGFSQVFTIDNNNLILPGATIYIKINVVSASSRYGDLTIAITP
jgi:hypothetical protein